MNDRRNFKYISAALNTCKCFSWEVVGRRGQWNVQAETAKSKRVPQNWKCVTGMISDSG